MAAKITFDDGKEVTLSSETTERLRTELCKSEKFSFSMDYFHCGKRENRGLYNSFPYYVVIGQKFTITEKPTKEQIDNNSGFFWSKEDVELMIENLQKTIGD